MGGAAGMDGMCMVHTQRLHYKEGSPESPKLITKLIKF